jgi:hypothetical protein
MDSGTLEATLRLLAPGFVLVKVFSQFGLRSRRGDLELTVWSVVAAWAVNLFVSLPGPAPTNDANVRLIEALVLGATIGALLARAWRSIWDRSEAVRSAISSRVWNFAFFRHERTGTPWVQVWLTSGHVVFGWPKQWSLDGEAAEPDLLLGDPSWVDPENQERTPMTGVDGVLVSSSAVRMVQFLASDDSPRSEPSVERERATSAPRPARKRSIQRRGSAKSAGVR